MDSEATVILRQPAASSGAHAMRAATAATEPSRTSRSESTAVFVGRASFQMIPAIHAARKAMAAAAEPAAPVERLAATPPPAVILLESFTGTPSSAEERAVPTLPLPIADAVPRLFSPGEVTEPIAVLARSGRPLGVGGSRVTARAVRTIIVALVAGATVTLSAEAVMRRPGKVPALKVFTPIASQPLAGAVAVADHPAAPEAAAAATPTLPTVVASTVTAAPAEAAEPALRPAPSRHRAQRLRATPSGAGRSSGMATTHSIKAPAAAPGATTAQATATQWIDPFAEPEPVAVKVTASKPSATTWVDPFAN